MKIRNGFVSNSSSSSFIVIGKKDQNPPKLHNAYFYGKTLHIPQYFGGQHDFTESGIYINFADRLNFAALVAWMKEGPGGYDTSDLTYTAMLQEVLINTFDIDDIKINFRYDDDYTDCVYMNPMCVYDCSFIPHNSHPSDDKNSTSIFQNRLSLEQFLFAPDSEIEVKYN